VPDKLHRCVEQVMKTGKTESQAYAICNAQLSDSFVGHFRDSAVYDPKEKTAISVRDGTLEYLGSEIGMEPPERMFTVYRSPATIANAAAMMAGIPITDEHVTLDMPAPSGDGSVRESEMVDVSDPTTRATIAVRNKLALGDTLLAAVDAGKRELSLGYNAELVPHDEFDFEQRNIVPHHLAAVPQGRCGPMCSFIDRKGGPEMATKKKPELHKAFTDADGQLNLQQVVELAQALPEAIKAVPMDQLQELLPAMQQVVAAAKEVMPQEEQTEPPAEAASEPAAEGDTPSMDGDQPSAMPGATPDEQKKQFGDAVDRAAEAKARKLIDNAVRHHAGIVQKARDFLDSGYDFAARSATEIMRDALATETSEQFTDAELPLAFKMLKRTESRYKSFGDSDAASKFDNLADKEI